MHPYCYHLERTVYGRVMFFFFKNLHSHEKKKRCYWGRSSVPYATIFPFQIFKFDISCPWKWMKIIFMFTAIISAPFSARRYRSPPTYYVLSYSKYYMYLTSRYYAIMFYLYVVLLYTCKHVL